MTNPLLGARLLKPSSLHPLLLILFTLGGCSSPEEAQAQKVMLEHSRGEYIHRKTGQQTFSLPDPHLQPAPTYPWEKTASRS